jgi:hypothetical protein
VEGWLYREGRRGRRTDPTERIAGVEGKLCGEGIRGRRAGSVESEAGPGGLAL